MSWTHNSALIDFSSSQERLAAPSLVPGANGSVSPVVSAVAVCTYMALISCKIQIFCVSVALRHACRRHLSLISLLDGALAMRTPSMLAVPLALPKCLARSTLTAVYRACQCIPRTPDRKIDSHRTLRPILPITEDLSNMV